MTQFKQLQNITINLWVNFSTTGSYNICDSLNVFKLQYKDDGSGFNFEITDSSNNTFNVRSGSSINTNEWKMVTCVYNQSSLELYVDSSLKNSTSSSGNALYDGQYGIKCGGVDGRIQEFRLYDEELTSSEITELYNIVNTPGSMETSKKQFNK